MLDWTSDIMAKLHSHKITQRQLAAEMGCSYQYVCSILRGMRKSPEDMPGRMENAIKAIVEKR